ncbi:MAG: NAD(P)/FAD-dependent oxidoreductase, partial [Rhizobacter sp.]|nr:NAD(P)/FAD-dependent oxidoreductase [Rhizobacter sp.]
GISGIDAAYRLKERCPRKSWLILESRERVGGTWDLFRYPGVRSDSDMFTLGYRLRPWTAPRAIADGASILRYIRDTADEAGVVPKIRFGHAVRRAEWSTAQAEGVVHGERLADGAAVVWRARFLYVCAGYYSYAEGHRPEFAGEAEFGGPVVHPQFWPEALDVGGKRVVVIGSGATAVTLVPALARTAAHVTMLQRSPSYVVARPGRDKIAEALLRVLPLHAAAAAARWKNVLIGTFYYRLARRRPQQVRQRLVDMAGKLAGPGCDAHVHFSPRYDPWDQRVCLVPDADLFVAIRNGSASVVTDSIERFTPDGIRLASGTMLPADVVVVATGLKLNVLGDIALTVDGSPTRAGDSMAYRGMMLSDIPNLALCFGYTNASWTLKADLTSEFVCRLLRHMDRRGATIVVPRGDPSVGTAPFLSFTSGYVQRALDRLPKQGTRMPWQVRQSYLHDVFAIRCSRLDDGVLGFGTAAAPP